MRALVISGGGSKGAFAGGVAQFLMQEKGCEYDMFLGTSTGSLLVPHLAVGKIHKLYNIFTNVQQQDIFSISPFVQRKGERRDPFPSAWRRGHRPRAAARGRHAQDSRQRDLDDLPGAAHQPQPGVPGR